MHLSRTIGLVALTSATCVSATPLGIISSIGEGAVRFGLRNVFRLNETSIDAILYKGDRPLEYHPYAIDLTDDNWPTALATGTPDNAFATPLPDDTIWVVNVHGPDPTSKAYTEALDQVARENSSLAGGDLPKQIRFARLSYNAETVLTTRWWLWRPPMIVIATNKMQDLRFIQPTLIRAAPDALAELLSKPEIWENIPVWRGSLSPGGKFEWGVARLADAWARWHRATSKIPNVVLLGFSGFIMNIFLSWLHSDDGKKKKKQLEDAAKAKVDQANAKIEEVKESEGNSSGVKRGGKMSRRK